MTDSRREWDNPDAMLSVDDALQRILDRFAPLPAELVPIVDALGMVLAEDVVAGTDIPPFRNSAMDGYALRSQDTRNAPASLRIVGSVAAGDVATLTISTGETIRIMTGAPVPDGADAVARFEDTDELDAEAVPGSVRIQRPVRPGENVREAGEDIRAGSVALRAGTRLFPASIGLLASLNISAIAVHRRPRVAILSTGDELVAVGDPLPPGKIWNSNSYTIASLVKRCGGVPHLLGVARDSSEDLRNKLRAAGNPDMFVTSGGVSVGDYDMVKDVLRSEGAIDIWQVRMKPGKPLAFGTIGAAPLLGLPGNPAAALVSFEQFGRPAILTMLGRKDVRIPELTATLTERVTNAGRRRHFVRGIVTRAGSGFEVRPAGKEGSAMLSTAVASNCFLVVPETCDLLETGDVVTVQLPDEGVPGGRL